MIENLAEAYKNIPIKNILKEFLIFWELAWKSDPKTFLVYFKIIEYWYEQETWETLSFKWQDISVGYDDYLGF
jgi:hypothetical protein